METFTAEDVRPLAQWKEEIEQGKKLFHATLPFEYAGKNEHGKYVRVYGVFKPGDIDRDNLFVDTFEQLVANCDRSDLWALSQTAEATISLFRSLCDGLTTDDDDYEDEACLTQADIDEIKKINEEQIFPEMRQKGYKRWREEGRAKEKSRFNTLLGDVEIDL